MNRIQILRTLVAVALLASIAAGDALGQGKTGTALAQFLAIEPSARFAGMGNAGVAISEGIQSVYYNPASLGRLNRITVAFTHSEWLADIDYNYFAAGFPVLDWGNAFLSVTSLDSGDIEVRTVEMPLGTGERYSVADLAIGVGFGTEIEGKFAAGVQANYVTEQIWHTSMSTGTLNLGAVYRLTDDGFQIGASISNYGSSAGFSGGDLTFLYDLDPDRYGDNSSLPGQRSTDDFPVPVLFRVGASHPFRTGERSRLLLGVDAFHPNDNEESMSAGAEWMWRETLSLRAGYQNLFLDDSELGWTLGLGLGGSVTGRAYGFDYAWADHGRLEETHRLTFALGF